MGVRLSGAQLKAFRNRPEGENEIWEDDSWIINGKEIDGWDLNLANLSDDDACVLQCGSIYEEENSQEVEAFATVLRRWLKSQTKKVVSVEINIADEANFLKFVKEHKWKVLK